MMVANSPAADAGSMEFDLAVADMYRAAAGETPWRMALERLVAMLRAFGAYLHGLNLADGTVSFGYEVGGFHPDAPLAYIRRYHQIDPRIPLVLARGVGEWSSCHEHIDEAAAASDPFYQEFLIPYGGRYVSGAKVYQDKDLLAILGIHSNSAMGPLGQQRLALAQRLGVHVGFAVGLWRRQRALLREMTAGHAVLERMSQPVLLVDEHGHMQYCNPSAHRVLERDPRLRARDGQLVFASLHDRMALLTVLRRLRLAGEAGDGLPGPASDKAVLRLESPQGQPPMLMLVLPLRPKETLGAFGNVGMALLMLHDLDARPALDPFIVAAAFDLTPAEARVAVRVASGDDVDSVARDCGVAVSTVRSQLLQVHTKVGVRRQSELAAALAGLSVLAAAPGHG